MTKNKVMNLKEFVNGGFLLEANRQFFHPLGLALFAVYENYEHAEDETPISLGVYDWRDDKEGGAFSEFTDRDIEKSLNVKRLYESKIEVRKKIFDGEVIQPIVLLNDGEGGV